MRTFIDTKMSYRQSHLPLKPFEVKEFIYILESTCSSNFCWFRAPPDPDVMVSSLERKHESQSLYIQSIIFILYSSYFIILSHYTPPPIISLSNGTNPLVEDYEDISWAKTYLTKHKTTVEFAPAENVKTFYF